MTRGIDITAPVRPEMNVTPLVDVVLVLLIVFMVIAPRLQHDVPINLPQVVNPDPVSGAGSDALQVTISADGDVYIDRQRYDREQALDALQSAHARDPLRRMVIRADKRLNYREVRLLCAAAQKIGFPGVALMVNEHHSWPEAKS